MGFLYFIVFFSKHQKQITKKTLSPNFFIMATPRKSAKKSVKKSSNKSGLTFPAGRVGSMLRKGRFSRRVSRGAAVFLAATLEYLTAETLELASKTVAKGSRRITPRALTLAIRHDADLGSLLQNVTISRGGVTGGAVAATAAKKATKKKKAAAVAASGKKNTKSVAAAPAPKKKAGAGATFTGGFARNTGFKWQYKNNWGGFSDYESNASDAVEFAYKDWQQNPHIDVPAVKSGDWAYMVDFNQMKQQNVQHPAHTQRDIRRVKA